MLRAFARPPGAIAASATRDATREDDAKFANQKARATVGRKPRAPRARARDDDDRAIARDWADVDARGFGRGSSALDRARYVVRDAKARLALPSSDGGVVGERPFSDVVYGCAFCAATTYALGAVDCWMRANAMARAPFMIGAWASLSVLAFGVVDAPPLRWWNLIVATTCSALIGVLSVRAFGANHVARAVALGASLALMMRLGAIHPPAGAVAFAAVESPAFADLGWWFAVYPALIGAVFIACAGKACEWVKLNRAFEFADVARVFSSAFSSS